MGKSVLPREKVACHFEVRCCAAAFLKGQVKVRKVDVSFVGIDDQSRF